MKHAYAEPELVENRASLLLFGGTATERRAWATEAADAFSHEGALREVSQLTALESALALKGGVVYVPDVLALGREGQMALVRCLQLQEERPKFVLGILRSPVNALADGSLRDDLHYRLSQALVNLALPEVQTVIRGRRQEKEKIVAAQKAVALANKIAMKARPGTKVARR